jgi:exosortase/archaeosortase family protein
MTQLVGVGEVDLGLRRARLAEWRSHWQARWQDAQPRTRTAIQLAVVMTAVVCAYSYSLKTLLQTAGMDTPLAYTSLVPVIALGLAAARSRPMAAEPAIHDRQVDYIVGIPLIAAAMVINLTLPGKLSVMYWVWRIDLLSLPMFVAGVVAIVFGVRVLWRQRLAVGYLFLAWPWPYSVLLLRVLNASTNATLAGLRMLLHVLPVAKPVQTLDGTLFVVVHNGRSFPLSVVSACSGINGIVGFLLVGVAFAAVVHGPFLHKALWLTGGMLMLWIINLGRLLFIFWAGREWGESVAINILHPFVGLVTFGAGVAIMVLAIRPLGMSTGSPIGGLTAAMAGSFRRGNGRQVIAVPTVYAAIAVVLVAAIVLGVSNLGLRSYDLVTDAAGEPKLLSYHSVPVAPEGWRWRLYAEYDWAKPLFGANSTWLRYSLVQTGTGGDLRAPFAVTADVIDTSNLETFSAYGVEACYQFHGLAIQDVAQVNVGGGITGQAMSFSGANRLSWSIVYWIVPVKTVHGTNYERVVLYLFNTRGTPDASVPRGVKIVNVAGSLERTGPDAQLLANRTFLVAFAHELILRQARQAAGSAAHANAAVSLKSADR